MGRRSEIFSTNGNIDIIVLNAGPPPSLLLNTSKNANHRVLLKLEGTQKQPCGHWRPRDCAGWRAAPSPHGNAESMARMTGGGFGGCTINLIAAEDSPEFQRRVATEYETTTDLSPDIYICEASQEAEAVNVNDVSANSKSAYQAKARESK